MATLPYPQDRDTFKVAIICAIPLEAEMVQHVFELNWADYNVHFSQAPGDLNTYSIGVISGHNVVLVQMPGMGLIHAATVAGYLSLSFHNIEVALLVGICGVVPRHLETQEEIVLGDCVISTSMVQYDLGHQLPGCFVRRSTERDSSGAANPATPDFIARLQAVSNLRHFLENILHNLKILERATPKAVYPGTHKDRLYDASYVHTHHGTMPCDRCIPQAGVCTKSCDSLGCQGRLIPRQRLTDQDASKHIPMIHFGRYGSANTVLKSGAHRDQFAKKDRIIAFEMEGAGLWNDLPTIIIKSACDYADSHKSKEWQPYAAVTAAAVLKAFLDDWPIREQSSEQDCDF
ncbi:MAG: hypothetical protein GOMPHAMPRED_007502 [Gomphillus americanus]|uniref:Nucleoside phosphorylase domain-containing protein n=1 Tax=Gomphillus americanus TaxID=1940652 RepID=A0A8H3IB14_9LECA|nr:MAG: hypothetical protein GOMPHAMPRED_007502 [Gomphillus americanus]